MYWMGDEWWIRAKARDTHIVVAVEEDQENGDGRRQQKQPIFGEHIGLQQTTTGTGTDFVLLVLIDAIEGGEVDVGRSLVDVDFVAVVTGAEDAGKKEEDVSLTR